MPNKRGGRNKRGGWTKSLKLINGGGPNKRGGWKKSEKSINGGCGNQLNIDKYGLFNELFHQNQEKSVKLRNI